MTNFISKKGLFGYKVAAANSLEEYKKPNKKMTGTVYEIKPTASGISVLRNGTVVCEGLESIAHEEDQNFFIGYKKGQQICFDAANGKEIDIQYCSYFRPNYVIAKDGSVYSINNNTVAATAREKKAFFDDEGKTVHAGMSSYVSQNEDGTLNITSYSGENILDSFTADKYVKCYLYNTSHRSKIGDYVKVLADGKQTLIDQQTKKVFYETELDRKVEVCEGRNVKMAAIVDYDETANKSAVQFIIDNNVTNIVVDGKAYAVNDAVAPAVMVSLKDGKKEVIKYIDKDGKDITATAKAYYAEKDAKYELEKAEAEVKRLEAIAEEADSSNRRTAVTNTLMGASLMGLGKVSTGATVMATSAIMRHNREQEVEEARKKAAEARKKLEALEAKKSHEGPSK